MNATNIGWTDFSSNPVKYRDKNTGKTVWACVKHSPGCVNCYAESLGLRWGKGKPFLRENMKHVEPFLDTAELRDMLNPKNLPAGKRVFIEDMSDLFGDWVPDAFVDAVFAVAGIRQDVIFQLLTKRADRMAAYLNERVRIGLIHAVQPLLSHRMPCQFPFKNVLIGFSAEDQTRFDERWSHIEPLAFDGWKTWASFEPLLGRIDARAGLSGEEGGHETGGPQGFQTGPTLSWAVVGGESGANRRACEVEAITNLAEQFRAAEIPIFVKQDSDRFPGKQGRIPLNVWDLKQHPESMVSA